MTKESIEKDIEAAINTGKVVGYNFTRLVININTLIEARDMGVKYFQFSNEKINSPSKIKGYVGKKHGLKIYVRDHVENYNLYVR